MTHRGWKEGEVKRTGSGSRTRRRTGWLKAGSGTTIMLVAAVLWLFPVYWLVVTSLEPAKAFNSGVASVIPSGVSLSIFKALFAGKTLFSNASEYRREILNSVVVSLAASTITVVISVPLMWLVRLGMRAISEMSARVGVVVSQIVPAVLLLVGLYNFVSRLGLLNSLEGLVSVYVPLSVPFTLWLLLSLSSGIPEEVLEAARVDGATEIGVGLRILSPMMLSGIVTAWLLSFLFVWGEFLLGSLIEQTFVSVTLPVALEQVRTYQGVLWQYMAAEAVVVMFPPIAVVLFGFGRIRRGLTEGALR